MAVSDKELQCPRYQLNSKLVQVSDDLFCQFIRKGIESVITTEAIGLTLFANRRNHKKMLKCHMVIQVVSKKEYWIASNSEYPNQGEPRFKICTDPKDPSFRSKNVEVQLECTIDIDSDQAVIPLLVTVSKHH